MHQTVQFLREGQMGSTLRHPNIVPIYEVHADRRQPFLVLEFVEGRSLREFVKIRKKLERKELPSELVPRAVLVYMQGQHLFGL